MVSLTVLNSPVLSYICVLSLQILCDGYYERCDTHAVKSSANEADRKARYERVVGHVGHSYKREKKCYSAAKWMESHATRGISVRSG